MFIFRAIAYFFVTIVTAVLLYLTLSLAALLLTPDTKIATNPENPRPLYLFHDLAHTEIIFRGSDLTPRMQRLLGTQIPDLQKGYIAFSYGDRDFMLHTPKWSDLDPLLACRALFIDTPALIRVGHYRAIRNDRSILSLTIGRATLVKLQEAIFKSMQRRDGRCIALPVANRPPAIYYCLAKHPYNLFYTCNQWSADMLHAAGLPVPRWAPLAWEVIYPLQRAAKGG